jgi:hypothetical protein
MVRRQLPGSRLDLVLLAQPVTVPRYARAMGFLDPQQVLLIKKLLEEQKRTNELLVRLLAAVERQQPR